MRSILLVLVLLFLVPGTTHAQNCTFRECLNPENGTLYCGICNQPCFHWSHYFYSYWPGGCISCGPNCQVIMTATGGGSDPSQDCEANALHEVDTATTYDDAGPLFTVDLTANPELGYELASRAPIVIQLVAWINNRMHSSGMTSGRNLQYVEAISSSMPTPEYARRLLYRAGQISPLEQLDDPELRTKVPSGLTHRLESWASAGADGSIELTVQSTYVKASKANGIVIDSVLSSVRLTLDPLATLDGVPVYRIGGVEWLN